MVIWKGVNVKVEALLNHIDPKGIQESKTDPPDRPPEKRCQLVRFDQGNCSRRVAVGVVDPMFTRMGSRSFVLPVYFTWPERLTSSRM